METGVSRRKTNQELGKLFAYNGILNTSKNRV